MLIDFSDVLSVSRLSLARLSSGVVLTPLQVNVFKLGSTYKALLKECTIEGVEPMLPEHLVYRFATKLEFGSMTERVAQDAVRLVQRMDRDWMTTGRRPSGVCGACLILAARMNNFRRTVREVVYIAKVTEITITKRLDEFKVTASSNLTVDQFRIIDLEKTHDPPAFYEKKAGTRKRKRTRQGEDEDENESDRSEDDGAQSDAQTNDQRPRSERAASNAPPQRPPRRDKDGFAIPDIPIDPKLLAASASALSELTNPLAAAKAIASETESEARPRKRAKTKYPEPSAEEIADEQALEIEISRLVNDPSTQERVDAYAASTAAKRSAAEATSRAGTPGPAESIAREAMLRASRQATPRRDKAAATLEPQSAAESASSQSSAKSLVAPLSGARRRALLRSTKGKTPADTEAVSPQEPTQASGRGEVAAISTAASGSIPSTAASTDGAQKTTASPATASSADGREESAQPSASAPAGPETSPAETATLTMETAPKDSMPGADGGSPSEPLSPKQQATPATPGQKSVPAANPASCTNQEALSTVRTTEDISDSEFADDPEVLSCMLSPEEQEIKERIWVHENRDYLREQQRKMLRRQLEEKNGTKKNRVTKRKNQGRVGEGGNGERAMSAAEATIDMLERRAPSRKINYEIIKEMFGQRKSADASREGSVAASEGAASVTSASDTRSPSRRTRAAAASRANVQVSGAAAIAKDARATTTEKGSATTSNDTKKDSNDNDASNEEANDDEDDGGQAEEDDEEVDVDDDEVMYDEPEDEIPEDMDDYDDGDGGYY